MRKQFFVGPIRDGQWRWYAEIDGRTVQRGRLHATECAAIRAACNIGAPTISRFRYAYENRGSLERDGDRSVAEVEVDLGIRFAEPWDD